MAWTTTNLLIQIIAGFVGAHLTSTAMHELHFGWIGHSIVGLIAGAFSGYFLQTIVLTVVTASGSLNEPRPADVVMIEALTGAVVGGIAMAAVGLLFQRDGKAGE
jgi:hypothetical protein